MRLPLLPILFFVLLAMTGRASSETVILTTGERLDAERVVVQKDTVVITHRILGTLEVPLDDIRSIDGKSVAPAAEEESSTGGGDASPPVKKNDAGTDTKSDAQPGSDTESEWKGSFTLSGSFNEGTTQNTSLFTELTYGRDNAREQTSISTYYRFASSSGETTQSWFNISGNQLWKIQNSPWGIFADAEFDWSEFNTWEQRFAAHAGGQYRFLDLSKATNPELWVKTLTLDGRLGAGPRKEFAGIETDLVAEGEIGAILNMSFAEDQTIAANASFYPVLSSYDDYRFEANLNWKMPLHLKGLSGLSLALGIKYQYQLEVSPDDKNYNLLGTLGVTYDF